MGPRNKSARGAKKIKSTKLTRIRRHEQNNYCSIEYCAMSHAAAMGLYGRTWGFGKGGMAETGMGCMGELYLLSAWFRISRVCFFAETDVIVFFGFVKAPVEDLATGDEDAQNRGPDRVFYMFDEPSGE